MSLTTFPREITTLPVPISQGGSGQTTANTALNAFLPAQTANANKVLTTDGTNTSWATNGTGDFSGPSSATANAIVRFSGTGGKTGLNSTVTISDTGTIAAASGTLTLTAPVFTAPVLGTPASGVATNLTGAASGLTAGSVTTNANLTGVITSVGNATSIASQTGTGTKFVVDTAPSISAPTLTGNITLDKTIAGSTGPQTINKTTGQVQLAAAGTSLVVTNSLVTANSIIIATVASNDTTCKSVQAVAGGGSFTLFPNAAPAATTLINFLVTN